VSSWIFTKQAEILFAFNGAKHNGLDRITVLVKERTSKKTNLSFTRFVNGGAHRAAALRPGELV